MGSVLELFNKLIYLTKIYCLLIFILQMDIHRENDASNRCFYINKTLTKENARKALQMQWIKTRNMKNKRQNLLTNCEKKMHQK